MNYLLDSDAVIDFLRGFAPTVTFVQALVDRGDSLALCDVVVAEVCSLLTPTQRSQAERLFSRCAFLDTSFEAARQAGEWRFAYARRGIALSTTDMLIAATALAHGAGLVTANVRDFPMSEVVIVSLPR